MLAASERGGLLHAPDLYMEKLVVGPSSKDVVDLDAPVRFNLRAIAQALGRRVEDLVVIVLDRPRHEQLIEEIRATGARIRLIGDGDLSAGIAAAVVGSGVHAVMGTGGAPEGVLTAAAMRCLNGEIFARLVVNKPEHEERCRAMGITDFKKIYRSKDLASGERIIFAATGVTDGTLMRGVRFFGDGTRTTSLIMQTHPHQIRFIDSIQVQHCRRTSRSGSEIGQLRPGSVTRRPITAAAFVGFTGFTLVMPFLPLYFRELGVTDIGDIALWTGVTLGVSPAIAALTAPLWGRVGDRFGNKLLVQRSLVSFIARDDRDGLRDAAVAPVRAARDAGVLRRLRPADAVDGGAVGAARQGGVGDRHGADGAAHGTDARSGHRRHARAGCRPAECVPRRRRASMPSPSSS